MKIEKKFYFLLFIKYSFTKIDAPSLKFAPKVIGVQRKTTVRKVIKKHFAEKIIKNKVIIEGNTNRTITEETWNNYTKTIETNETTQTKIFAYACQIHLLESVNVIQYSFSWMYKGISLAMSSFTNKKKQEDLYNNIIPADLMKTISSPEQVS